MKGRNSLPTKASDQQILMPTILVPSEMPTAFYPEYFTPQMRPESLKRPAEYSTVVCKRPALEGMQFPMLSPLSYQPVFQFPVAAERELNFKYCECLAE